MARGWRLTLVWVAAFGCAAQRDEGVPSRHRQFFVSPRGNAAARGTRSDPWDLTTALRQASAVRPGDTIWLLGGVYGSGGTYFTSNLTGAAQMPIVVRQFPGERATINGSLIVNGAYTWYRDFEVTSSFTDRTGDGYNPAAGTLDGLDINGPFTKFINLIVHDTREGFGVWTPAAGAEVYGCIIYNNGWQGPDRGHGHGIYTQNRDDRKRLASNIIFNQFGAGIHGYGSGKAFVRNYLVDHNIVFNNGLLAKDGATYNILFASNAGVSGIRVENNYTYHVGNIGTSQVGWSYGANNLDVALLNNFLIGGYIGIGLWNWNSVAFTGNTVYSDSIDVYMASGRPDVMANNRYYGAGMFYLQRERLPWSSWQRIESSSSFTSGRPSGTWAFVTQNEYESGRANIVIYNWNQADAVSVDLSPVLVKGCSFEIRDAENIFGGAVVSGIYEGGAVKIPMKGLRVTQPLGRVPVPPKHTAPEFGAFVVRTNDLSQPTR